MNNGAPSAAAATNGREPFALTPAGPTPVTGRPAEPSAAAIPGGPRRRSGTPNKTSTPAPTVTQAARRHGRLSHGAAATVTATAAARSAEAASDPPVSHGHWPAPPARSPG